MSDAVYRKTEIVGSSDEGLQQAIQAGINRARKTLRHLDWFEVTEIRGYLGGNERQDGSPEYWQVTMKVGFRLDE
ncbi:MAG TPA: dodecin [Acidimicrobiia bacterium]|nr:dodecin [Acidimicrobiia bacterium]